MKILFNLFLLLPLVGWTDERTIREDASHLNPKNCPVASPGKGEPLENGNKGNTGPADRMAPDSCYGNKEQVDSNAEKKTH